MLDVQPVDTRLSLFNQRTRLDFERLITEISLSLLHPAPDQTDDVIHSNLQKILDFLGIDRAVLWQRDGSRGERFIITHLRSRPGTGPQEIPEHLTTDDFPWITAQVLQGKETKYSRIDDLPEEAAVDKQTIRKFADKYSSMAVPLFEQENVYGILTLGIAEELTWPDDLAPQLRVVASIFSNALVRSKAEQKLRETLKELEKVKAQLEQENVYLLEEVNVLYSPTRIIHQSRTMKEILVKAEQVAATNSSVLLVGETGTGKEMVALAIHNMSPRSRRAMIRVNCGAIPAALIESELFGREKGAYTGALSRQIGRFELAHESTIFLDEIVDLPLEVQVKLLRVLQEKEIERLGNPRPISINVRVIAAANQRLEKAIQDGKFRDDLYYRLNVFPIEIPPLRERKEDIPMLVWSFVDLFSTEFGKKVESISKPSMNALIEYTWPGNVRELRNTVERAMITLNSPMLNIELPKTAGSVSTNQNPQSLKEMEIQHILKVLEAASWKIRGKNGAAEILGIKPTTLETRMTKLGIARPGRKAH